MELSRLQAVTKIRDARNVARTWHSNQTRKYTGEPYFNHLQAVVDRLLSWGYNEWEIICAAYLHDIVEDQNFTFEEIERKWGFNVAQYVWYLTNVPLIAGNRAKRNKLNVQRLSEAPWQAKVIKCADLIDNTSTIVEHDPKFAETYLKEKESILWAMLDGMDFDGAVIRESFDVLNEAKAKLCNIS